jgi:hypothetical protein
MLRMQRKVVIIAMNTIDDLPSSQGVLSWRFLGLTNW